MGFGQLGDDKLDQLTSMLSELVQLELEIQRCIQFRGGPGGSYSVGVDWAARDTIKKWLEKAREIACTFQPREFTVTAEVGLPPRVSASFTWDR